MAYQLNLNLRQRAALQIAISFWARKEVKDRIVEVFDDYEGFLKTDAIEKWYLLTETFMKEWTQISLPQNVKVELIHIVRLIGEKIFYWYLQIEQGGLKDNLKDNIDKIYWTPSGTVDTMKIFKISSIENQNLRKGLRYNLACDCASKEFVTKIWKGTSTDSQTECNLNMCKHHYFRYEILYVNPIVAYWAYCRDLNFTSFMQEFEFAVSIFRDFDDGYDFLYNQNLCIEVNMFRLSVYVGQSYASKYFWDKLTKREKNVHIVECAHLSIEMCSEYEMELYPQKVYAKEAYVEICVFLMSQMTKVQRNTLFNKYLGVYSSYMEKTDIRNEILKMLLLTWPWQELFIPILTDMLQNLDENNTIPFKFLKVIREQLDHDHKLGYPKETSVYNTLLREALQTISACNKQKVDSNDTL